MIERKNDRKKIKSQIRRKEIYKCFFVIFAWSAFAKTADTGNFTFW